ncbi:4-hydroxyphenylpyruvate dioxygenase family protein [Anaeromyxobacter sp. Fw109-5]|uniref:4-hydroxyphenylpyruvate dioxygenase family protein n=1 Tax=Anaeromyxobacter sp. (strain Fw109-5) TaxID=404589 RepID=UPI0000ED70F5|nr:VOC family protein [Anaeromyxobacter sp. Fw109-5]ABS27667.1 4-hydroxyphenylpyruvate dioxygenase [Anaeromyxobacter sp. Fw109-5]
MTTTRLEPLGIRRIEALHYYVHDLERSRRFYVERLDFSESGASTPELEREGRQRSAAFEAGDVRILCSQPAGEGGRAWRYLRKHPDGVGAVIFEVEDAERAFRLLEERGGTPITDLQVHEDDGGTLRTFNITTPLGDTTFRFVERRGYRGLYPGVARHAAPKGGANAFGFGYVDHLTSNFQTMKPALLWMEHVLGLEEFWEVQFHTKDAAEAKRAAIQAQKGSGLRSVVMKDPASGVKFANNEPWRPAFKSSQINVFNEDHRGDGIQHAALTVADILSAVRGLRARGVEFMPTPASYYEALPERIRRTGIGRIDEQVETLRELEILVDGAGQGSYLLQIFLRDAAGLYHEPAAGPFFFEIIQRKGDQGFGAGNFRALFESIEREQQREGRT